MTRRAAWLSTLLGEGSQTLSCDPSSFTEPISHGNNDDIFMHRLCRVDWLQGAGRGVCREGCKECNTPGPGHGGATRESALLRASEEY